MRVVGSVLPTGSSLISGLGPLSCVQPGSFWKPERTWELLGGLADLRFPLPGNNIRCTEQTALIPQGRMTGPRLGDSPVGRPSPSPCFRGSRAVFSGGSSSPPATGEGLRRSPSYCGDGDGRGRGLVPGPGGGETLLPLAIVTEHRRKSHPRRPVPSTSIVRRLLFTFSSPSANLQFRSSQQIAHRGQHSLNAVFEALTPCPAPLPSSYLFREEIP